MAEDYRKYLDPKVLNKVGGLELKARLIVEGFVSGLHESPYKGSSVEFAEHRQYVPGDDIRHVDWKVFGKSDRFYIKEYEEETNLKAYVVLDVSKSMEYASEEAISKLEYSKYSAAAILHLIKTQQDAGALVLFSSEIEQFMPPSSNPSHFRNMMQAIAESSPDGDTDLGLIFSEIAERLRHRSLIIIFSDLLDDEAAITKGLAHMSHRGHDVIIFHVMDNAELTFPFERMTRFEGLEVDQKLISDPRDLREAYLEELHSFQTRVRTACLQNRTDYVSVNTSARLDVVLTTYLAQRAGSR